MFLSISASSTTDTLLVGYTGAPPFVITEDGELSGINLWLWDQVARDLNIDYKLVELPFRELMTSITNGEIDVCINPLTMTADRSKSMVFTSPFYVANGTTVIQRENDFNHVRHIITSFFSKESLSALILLLFIVAFFGWLTWLAEKKNNPIQFRPGLNGLWDGLWWSSVTMTTVGYGDKTPKSFAGQVIALIWMFTALLFISGLTASIASNLLDTQRGHLSLTLNDLRELDVGTMENTSTEEFLRTRFFRKIRTFDSIQEGFSALENGNITAFIYDEPIIRYRLLEMPNADLQITNSKFNLQLYAFALSDKRENLSSAISERILHYTNSLQWNVLLSNYELEVL